MGRSRSDARGRLLAVVATAVWAVALLAGATAFLRYQFAPGAQTHAPSSWPAGAELTREATRPTLVLFAHPGCACTRASLKELQVVMARVRTPLTVQAVFVQLPGVDAEATRDGSWELAGRIPGVERHVDIGGREAQRFAALVSGYTLLYDAAGQLLFEGGITASRGHEGANTGRSSLVALLRDATADVPRARTPVFGCHLFDRRGHEAPGDRAVPHRLQT
jgi:hypothetical protein